MKYTLPENDKPSIVGEPVAVAIQSQISHEMMDGTYYNIDEDSTKNGWNYNDAPCQYTIDELQDIIIQGEEDIANGISRKHTDVQQMALNKIRAWR